MFKRIVVVVLAVAAIASCDNAPTTPVEAEGELVGLWLLPTTSGLTSWPALYGFTQGTLRFSEDGTFLVDGKSMLSAHSDGDFDVSGAWVRTGEQLELQVGSHIQTWNVIVGTTMAEFTSLDGSTTFKVLRL